MFLNIRLKINIRTRILNSAALLLPQAADKLMNVLLLDQNKKSALFEQIMGLDASKNGQVYSDGKLVSDGKGFKNFSAGNSNKR